jgi:hypothetical protein
MNKTIIEGLALLLLTLIPVTGQTITASSNVFTFPNAVGIRNNTSAANMLHSDYFVVSATPGTVNFAWSVIPQSSAKIGIITVYSLLGRTIKTFSISSKAGMLSWKAPDRTTPSGIYIARLSYGSVMQNLKLVLY